MTKLNKKEYRQLLAEKDKKITVYMNPAHKWMLEELAHKARSSEKDILFKILQSYHDTHMAKASNGKDE